MNRVDLFNTMRSCTRKGAMVRTREDKVGCDRSRRDGRYSKLFVAVKWTKGARLKHESSLSHHPRRQRKIFSTRGSSSMWVSERGGGLGKLCLWDLC